MYAVFLRISLTGAGSSLLSERKCCPDDNWRVQEILAKAFDVFCAITGMSRLFSDRRVAASFQSKCSELPEGLGGYGPSSTLFKERPCEAIKRLSALRAKSDLSEYVRKSVGMLYATVLVRVFPLVATELPRGILKARSNRQVRKLAGKFIERDAAHAAGGAAATDRFPLSTRVSRLRWPKKRQSIDGPNLPTERQGELENITCGLVLGTTREWNNKGSSAER